MRSHIGPVNSNLANSTHSIRLKVDNLKILQSGDTGSSTGSQGPAPLWCLGVGEGGGGGGKAWKK